MTDERHDDHGRTGAFTRDALAKLLRNGHGEDQRRGDSGRTARGVSYATISLIVGVAGGLGALGAVAMDLGAQKQRIDTIEKRQVEDRTATGEKLNKVEVKVDQVDGKVNLILQEIRAMQAAQDAERRARRARD